MNSQKLKALRAVMLTGSVTEAAVMLHLTQPAISRSIAGLAEEVGFRLFYRHRGRLLPTPEGEAFYREAERVLMGVDDLARIARDIRQNKTVTLRIVAMPQLARGLLPMAIGAFSRTNPTVSVSLEIRERRQIDGVSGLQFDIGVVMLPLQMTTFVTQPFASFSAVAVVPSEHGLARKRTISVGDFVGEPFVALDRTSLLRHSIDGHFFDHGFEPRICAETSSAYVAGQIVAEGMGVSVLDPFTAHLLPLGKIAIRPWKPKAQLTFGFVYPDTARKGPFREEFSACVVQAAKEIQKRFPIIEGSASMDMQRRAQPRDD